MRGWALQQLGSIAEHHASVAATRAVFVTHPEALDFIRVL
jgi:hypothetical protein